MNKIINQGAEAVIESKGNEIIKKRINKSYRIKEIDEKIRKLRTRSEGKLLERASKFIPVPKVLKIDEINKEILMEKIEGKRLSDSLNNFTAEKQKQICKGIGENIAKLHNNNIIHGDLTLANMIFVKDKVYFIDFGLSFISPKVEDKAVDLHLLKESLEAGFANNWEVLFDSIKKGYSNNSSNFHIILERFKDVEKRGRYKQSS
ncbi:MAG: KEOPS complex kinase/ATPase Bud32 [Candidatus Nanoarchaeia archaeon]